MGLGEKSYVLLIFLRERLGASIRSALGSFFLSISVTICTLIIGESMGAIGAVVACYGELDVIVSLSDFHRGFRLCRPPPFL